MQENKLGIYLERQNLVNNLIKYSETSKIYFIADLINFLPLLHLNVYFWYSYPQTWLVGHSLFLPLSDLHPVYPVSVRFSSTVWRNNWCTVPNTHPQVLKSVLFFFSFVFLDLLTTKAKQPNSICYLNDRCEVKKDSYFPKIIFTRINVTNLQNSRFKIIPIFVG